MTVTVTVNFGGDTSTYSISLVAIDYVLVTFHVFGRGQRAGGAATWRNHASFFFTMTTDATFKRFMPGIARPSRQC